MVIIIIIGIVLLYYSDKKLIKKLSTTGRFLRVLFIITAAFFIGGISLIIAAVPSNVAILAYTILTGIFTIFLLIKYPKKYGRIFLIELIVVPILFFIVEYTSPHKSQYEEDTIENANKIFKKAWKNIKNPSKVILLLGNIKNPYHLQSINNERIALSFILQLKQNINNNLENNYAHYERHNQGLCETFGIVLENYTVTSKEFLEMLKIMKIAGFTDFYSCSMPSNMSKKHPFLLIIENNKYKNIDIIIENTEIETYSFINFAGDIYLSNDTKFKKRIIRKMLKKLNLNPYNNKDVILFNYVEVVLYLYEKDMNFKDYLPILKSKADVLSNIVYIDNEELKNKYKKMYNLLGADHILIKMVPEEITKFYLKNIKNE